MQRFRFQTERFASSTIVFGAVHSSRLLPQVRRSRIGGTASMTYSVAGEESQQRLLRANGSFYMCTDEPRQKPALALKVSRSSAKKNTKEPSTSQPVYS